MKVCSKRITCRVNISISCNLYYFIYDLHMIFEANSINIWDVKLSWIVCRNVLLGIIIKNIGNALSHIMDTIKLFYEPWVNWFICGTIFQKSHRLKPMSAGDVEYLYSIWMCHSWENINNTTRLWTTYAFITLQSRFVHFPIWVDIVLR